MIGMQGDGLGCTTASYYIPSAFIRGMWPFVKMKWMFIGFYLLLAMAITLSYKGIYGNSKAALTWLE